MYLFSLRVVSLLSSRFAASAVVWYSFFLSICYSNSYLSLNLMLRPTVSRPVCLVIERPSGAYERIFITVRPMRGRCGALSLTGGWVCLLQLLLALTSAITLGSQSRGTRDHILLPEIREFPFRRLLGLAGVRWRYSTPPP
jgi:hypothetical protein